MTDRSHRKPAGAQHRPFPTHIHRWPRWSRGRRSACGNESVQHRPRPGRTLEGRRAAAALGRAGGHRPGLPARRRDRRRHPQGPEASRARHHERRHRVQRRGVPRPRRAADQRGRAAARRRLRLRPDHGDRAGGRAEGHSARDQHCSGSAHHRAGLQVRVPQFPDRADDPGRRLRQPEGDLRGRRLGTEVGRVHARERHLRHGHAEGHRRRHAEVQHALQDRRDHRLRSGRPRLVGGGGEGQGDRGRGAAAGQPPQRCHAAHPRARQAALDADGACSAWGPAGTRTSTSRRWASWPTTPSASCPGTTPTRP